MQEMQVWSLGREDPLEKDMATHSNFPVIFQYSCPGNPIDRGAWWVPAHGVAKESAQLSDTTTTFFYRKK